jgi:hypothetical protein
VLLDSTTAARAVRQAWERARDAGAYRFSTGLTQLTYPARALSNSGRGPQTVELHLEGEVDLPARTMGFRMWQAGTSGSGSASGGVDGRVEGDRVYVRGADGSWQEVEDFTANFAPDSDPLAFLGGMVDVREVPPLEQSPSIHVSRFTFQLDGPKLADYLRDRLVHYLTEQGELPPGVSVDVPSSLRQMGGNGELWVDERGLPLRLTMHLLFPQQDNGSQVEADVQTSFSGFPQDEPEEPFAAIGSLLNLPPVSLPANAGEAAAATAVVACCLILTVILACRRSRRMYALVVTALVFSMVVVPAMQSARVAAFYDHQAARSQDLLHLNSDGQALDDAAIQEEQDAYQAVSEYLTPSWDPLQNPLAAPAQAEQTEETHVSFALPQPQATSPGVDATAAATPTPSPTPPALNCDAGNTDDPDGDGVNNYEECVYFTDSTDADTDNDGLDDGQELNVLATDPTEADTDGDGITDAVEVNGFRLGDQTWTLNPNNPDSNNDGMVDSAECPALVEVANPSSAVISEQCDADKDNIPDAFEFDNDNDGVPDAVDLSPNESVTYNGKGSGRATAATAFNRERPFRLWVTSLTAGWPVLVDLQLRPLITDHLSYAYNVLDWPANDVDGQIQHQKDTTFFDLNPQDTAGAQGDIRLIPMLEIGMTGELPLKLTAPKATVIVGRGTAVSSTVTLDPATSTSTRFTYGLPANARLLLYGGTCLSLDAQPLITLTGTTGTVSTQSVVQLADGNHALVITGTATGACAEIPDVVNGIYSDKMVDESVLAPYGITLNDEGDGSVVAYVPLNVATDDTGGGRSAFLARMIYWPGTTNRWVEPQTMKVVWLVQMLTDACAPGAKSWEEYKAEHKDEDPTQQDYDAYFDDWCATHRTADEVTPVQVYDEDWYLTGLVVREDHGLDIAVAYVNPTLSPYDDDALYKLSLGLGEQFLTGVDCRTAATIFSTQPQDCTKDDLRDVGVTIADHMGVQIANSTIEGRFDITATLPITTRWGIPLNAIYVDTFRYDHQDYLVYHSMTQTPRILAQYTGVVTPTILQAREERYRSARLEGGTMAQGGALTVDLNTTSYPETTLAGLLWTPYRYNGTAWEAFTPTEYWDYLEMDLGRRLREMYPTDPEDVNLGRMLAARSYSMALTNGVVNTVVHCVSGQLLCPNINIVPYTDDMIVKATKDMMNGLDAAIIRVIYNIWKEWKEIRSVNVGFDVARNGDIVAIDDALDQLDGGLPRAGNPEKKLCQVMWNQFKSYVATPYKTVFTHGLKLAVTAGVVIGAAAAAVIATIVIASVLKVERAQIGAIVIRSVSLLIATHCMIVAISNVVQLALKSVGEVGKALRAEMHMFGNINRAGVATTVLAVVVTWAAFGALIGCNHLARGSAAFAGELAYAIASSLVTIILFIIFTALGPIGAIIQAFIGMLNAIANLICSALPEKMQKGKAGYWLCGGITGFITNAFKWFFYAGGIMVKMNPDDYERLQTYGFSTALQTPEDGVVAGNAIKYSISLTNTIDLVPVPISLYEIEGHKQFSEETLARATFRYKWQEDDVDFHSTVGLDGMVEDWNETNGGRPLVYAETVPTTDPFPLPQTGINQPIKGLYLSEAYAVPEQVCLFSDCDIRANKDTNHYDLGSDLKYDVLPVTLSGFYQLASTEDGQVLAWGQHGSVTFAPLDDADGDGLNRLEDLDDSKWDSDGDGLSDAYEIETFTNPLAVDSDNDGLSDLEESRCGTDPNSADSDGDGLYDCQEVFHRVTVVGNSTARAACGEPGTWSGGWTITQGTAGGTPLTTRVTSNPLDPDSDGDGLTDAQEKTYGYNPNAINALNVLSLQSELSELASGVLTPSDGFVAPGQTLCYTATVKNELDNRQAQGLLSTEASVLDDSALLPQSFVLRPQRHTSLVGNLKVPSSASSGTNTVTQVAGASIVDLQLESGQAALWLQFDDAVGSYAYMDSSGREPRSDGKCIGTGCVLDPAGGRVGGALKLDGASYVRSAVAVPNTSYSVSFWCKVDAAHASSGALFASELNNRVRIELSAGHVVASTAATVMTSARTLGDNAWHHVVHTDPGYGGVGQQMLYIDGVQAAAPGQRSNWASTPLSGVLIGGRPGNYYLGAIDDVRLFEKVLTPAEVAELANQPLFHMDFDQTDRWADVSSYHTPIESCSPLGLICLPYGPTHHSVAVGGHSADFDGAQHLEVPAASQLDLSGGRFTLSAWIFPHNRADWSDPRNTFPQAILGLHSGEGNAYPTLQRVGRKIRFSLGTGSEWHTAYESGNVLMENEWNHVALTLDKAENGGTLRLYVNAKLVDTALFPVTTIAPTNSFWIGRSSNTGRVELTRYEQGSFHDEGVCQTCGEACRVEMCMAMNQTEVFDWKPGSCGISCPGLGITCPTVPQGVGFTDGVTLQLWEDDDDPHCGSAHSHAPTNAGNDDDECHITGGDATSVTSLVLTTNDAGFDAKTYTFDGCNSDGNFRLKYTHDSIPFYGRIDEVQIFGQPLDQDAIARLYLDPATLLHLPLDEAPGATAFEDMSLNHVPASCSGSGCPASGIGGRINQGAEFSSQGHTAIALGRSSANLLVNSFTVAAWIRPNSFPGSSSIVSTARTHSNDGWGFGLAGRELSFDSYGYANSHTSNLSLQSGRWTHVAVVVSAPYTVTFYVNGQMVNAGLPTGTYTGTADLNDLLLVGATTEVGQDSASQAFNGRIDDLWILGIPLSAESMLKLYETASILHLRFEEAYGATQFADNAAYDRLGTCGTGGCPVTGEGVRGQVGLAAEFDGQDDRVTLADNVALRPTTFSVGAWVKPVSASKTPVAGLYHELVGKWVAGTVNYRLYMADDLKPGLEWGCAGTDIKLAANQPLIESHWNHVLGTFDGWTLRLYVNGVEQSSNKLPAASACTSTAAVEIGGKASLSADHSFHGLLDEVLVFKSALSAGQVRDLYLYQSGWVEDRQTHDISVDSDVPTAELLLRDQSYLANRRVPVGVTARDATSGVEKVELGVQKGTGTVAWSSAIRCADATDLPAGAWCPQFAPSGPGVYRLQAGATDRVGHTALSAVVVVYVDDSPPALSLDQPSSLWNAEGSKKESHTWIVHLSGTVSDPGIAPSIPGSGVPEDGVQVALRDADGKKVGEERQTVPLSNMLWSLDYAIPDAKADGCLTVVVEAVDRVADLVRTDAEQLARHTTVVTSSIVLDASAPEVVLDKGSISGGKFGQEVIVLSGAISARPALLHVEMTGGAGADTVRARLSCQHDDEGSWYTLFDARPGTLADGTTNEWEGEIHQGSTCQVELTTTAASAVVSGAIEACGAQVTSWAGSFAGSKTVPFVVLSAACTPSGCSADAPVSGVAGVDVAFSSALPGSAFVDDVPLAGEILHLPFEDTPAENGVLVLRDVSASATNGSCGGGGCPTTGQPSPSGSAALFDGVNDSVSVAKAAGGTADYLTIATWIYPQRTPASRDTFLSREGVWAVAYLSTGTIGWTFNNSSPGYVWTDTGYKAPLNLWTHIVVVYDAGVIRTYANGALVHTMKGSGSLSKAIGLDIGSRPGKSEWFAGMLDEVRLFSRALTLEEIKALYTGSGPLLDLPFEESWATDGDRVSDASGWDHHGTLRTGAGDADNKATVGQVGSYALSFDGANDAVEIDDFGIFTTTTVSAWVYRSGATANHETIVSYKEAASAGFVLALVGQVPTFYVRVGSTWLSIADGTNPVGLQQWVHLAGTYDGRTIRLYRNAAQVAEMEAPGTLTQATAKTAIGSQHSLSAHWFPGAIDQVRIYGRALPAQEIVDLYHAGWRPATLTQSGNGVVSSRWAITVPPALEGVYDIEMRGRDVAGHVEAVSQRGVLWRGDADNLDPRVTLCSPVTGTPNRYVTVAQDFNLTEQGFSSPCPISSRSYFQSSWFVAAVPAGTQKLYQITAACQLTSTPTLQATACDTADNCVTVGLTTGGVCDAILASAAAAEAAESAHLAEIAVAAQGRSEETFIAIAPTTITTTHLSGSRALEVTGLVTGSYDVSGVDVSVGESSGPAVLSEPADTWPFTRTWSYAYLWPDDALPDGVARTTVATATLQGQPIAAAQEILTLDVVPPAAVQLTLTSNGNPIEPRTIIREAAPDLVLSWTPSADGSGLDGYRSVWSIMDLYTTTTTTVTEHDPAGPLEAHYNAAEVQYIAMGLTSRDTLGNERWQSFGAVLVDGPLTPDLLQIPAAATGQTTAGLYTGWMDSGCALMGTDDRTARRNPGSNKPPQQFYATWDRQALRLAFNGAAWSGESDVFIYLDTDAGGTDSTFTPYPLPETVTHVFLPQALGADRLIWMQDTKTASILRWDGSQWTPETALSAEQARYSWALNGGQVDLYLPFELLGIQAGDPLGLIAFATEDPVPDEPLRIWATLPAANPVNSARSNQRAFLVSLLEGKGVRMPLLHFYHWAALGDAVCPNGTVGTPPDEQQNDTQLRATITADPPGATVTGVGGGVFWAGDPEGALAVLGAGLIMDLLNTEHAPLLDGQPITYTVNLVNEGSHTLQGAWLEFTAFGQLALLDARADLGDMPPGSEHTVTVHGITDRSKGEVALAVTLARLYAAGHDPGEPALEWMVAANRVDRGAPTELGLNESAGLVGPGAAWLSGLASDESGITQIGVEILSPSGVTSTMTCDLTATASGYWSCPWDVTAANGGARPEDGDEFTVRLRATDRLGHTSNWTAPFTIRVDALPPNLGLATEIAGGWSGRVVRGGALRLIGDVADSSSVASVTVCVDGEHCRTADLTAPGSASSRWSQWITTAGALDYVTKTLTIRATDRLGNHMVEGITFPVVFDNVAPVIDTNQLLTQVPLNSEETVLHGQVTDGGPDVDTSVRVETSDGEVTRLSAGRNGQTWWFDLTADTAGRYTLWVDAEDLAGNVTTAGPFIVDVVCTDAALIVTRLSAEPVAGWPISLTLTAVISNAGPDPLPAGIQASFGEGGDSIGLATSSAALGSGQSRALSIVWASDGARAYDFAVAPAAPQDGVGGPLAAALCGAPEPVHFSVQVRDVPLYENWNLIAPPVQPDNRDVQVVQRGIAGDYAAILGYDRGLVPFYPAHPEESTLTQVDAGRGYWVRATSTVPLTDTLDAEPLTTWRMAGATLARDPPQPLVAGWNLIAYPPQASLPVTVALASIDGAYAAVLAFDRTGLSYYPDLDAASSYNTLPRMTPAGYWISATHAITLHYTPGTGTLPETSTPTLTDTIAYANRVYNIRAAEQAAGVQPTYTWMNLYGTVHLAGGVPAPIGTTVIAMAGSVPCGATVVSVEGHFGLLACYGDDETTPEVDGAQTGDEVTLLVNGAPLTVRPFFFNGQAVAGPQPIRWTGPGDRWELEVGTRHLYMLPIVMAAR